MAEIVIKSGHIVLIDDQDYDLVIKHKWWLARNKRANLTPYASSKIRTETGHAKIYMHRLITEAPKGVCVDHINGNGLDNRRCNLRFANKMQNAANSDIRPSVAGFRGVQIHHFCKNGAPVYRARVGSHGNTWQGHSTTDPAQAALDYDEEAYRRYGEFARLNFPERKRA